MWFLQPNVNTRLSCCWAPRPLHIQHTHLTWVFEGPAGLGSGYTQSSGNSRTPAFPSYSAGFTLLTFLLSFSLFKQIPGRSYTRLRGKKRASGVGRLNSSATVKIYRMLNPERLIPSVWLVWPWTEQHRPSQNRDLGCANCWYKAVGNKLKKHTGLNVRCETHWPQGPDLCNCL